MNLYIFPTRAIPNNGYGIAVLGDYRRLQPTDKDVVIWYATDDKISSVSKSSDIIIKRPKSICFSRVVNVLNNRVSCELYPKDLRFLDPDGIDTIFCGDVIIYRALRKTFPDKKIIVRFHNCFYRIYNRLKILDFKVNGKFYIDLIALCKLEKEIFIDKNVHKVFISDEDRDYYSLMMGKTSDSEVWSFQPDKEKMLSNRKEIRLSNKIVWYGGMDPHKVDSVKWFIDSVFKDLQKSLPDVEFHLWGWGTKDFNDPSRHIYGHGFYDKDDLPLSGEALYVNPDLIGGGIKIKLLSYLEFGAPFITTPFGFEGYSKDLIDSKYCYVVEKDNWLEAINQYVNPHNIC